MPYASMEDVNPAIKGIDPPVTLTQANIIASWADKIEDVESPYAVAIANFKKAYVVKDGSWVKRVEEVDMGKLHETLATMSLGEQERMVREAFQAEFGGRRPDETWRYWVRDVFIDPSEFGNALVVEDNHASRYYLISYSEEGDKIVFDDPPNWKTVVPTYRVETVAAEADGSPAELETVKLAETYAGVELLTVGISEADAEGPMTMKIQPIRPGFGNARDNNYYPAEMLKRDAAKFIGAKMHESDHKDDKSTRTWVSTITDVLGFSDVGAPVCEVVVHNRDFAERVQQLDAAEPSLLHKMECSILGDGKFRKGEVEGRKTNIVEALTRITDVDWVTRAGAGGKALSISESEDSMEEKEPKDVKPQEDGTPAVEPKVETPTETPTQEKPLSEKEVTDVLAETNLPESAKTYLAETEYENEESLKEAVTKHIEYLKAVTGSGKPFGHEGGGTEVTMDEEEYGKRYDGIMESHGVRRFGN